jgi:hypothetical protein
MARGGEVRSFFRSRRGRNPTLGTRAGMSRKGGERAYTGRLVQDRSPRHCGHSTASAKLPSQPEAVVQFFRPSCASTARRGCWFHLQICKMPALCHPKGTSWYKNNVMSYYFAHNSIMHDAVVFHEADLPNCRGAGIPCPVRAASFPSGDCACRPPH